MLVQHNIPLVRLQKVSLLRTKKACIINGAIAPSYQQALVEIMKNGPFSMAVDRSSDNGVEKMNPLTVRVIDAQSGIVHTQFLDVYVIIVYSRRKFLQNARCSLKA